MCGRFTLATSGDDVWDELDLRGPPKPIEPRYNVAPTDEVAVVLWPEGAPGPELRFMRWGLVPHFAGDPSVGHKMINARAESLTERPAFRDLLAHRRALVVADGFYEWKRAGKRKQPYFVHGARGKIVTFAALWDRWRGPSGPVESCTIITGPPSPQLASIHDRMPVMLEGEARRRWLAPVAEPWPALRALLLEGEPPALALHPVSMQVNKPGHDDPSNVERVDVVE